MKMLLLHTCGVEGSVAVADAHGVRATGMLPPRAFSEGLMPAIASVLATLGWGVGELEAVAVVSGPGSFTGVRTGLSVGKGLCEGRGIPLVAVSRLALLAQREGLVYAVLDAGRGEFYVGTYRDGVMLEEALRQEEGLRAAVAEEPGRVVVCEEKVAAGLAGLGAERVAEPLAGDALGMAMSGLRVGVDDVLGDANYVRRTDGEIFARPAGKARG